MILFENRTTNSNVFTAIWLFYDQKYVLLSSKAEESPAQNKQLAKIIKFGFLTAASKMRVPTGCYVSHPHGSQKRPSHTNSAAWGTHLTQASHTPHGKGLHHYRKRLGPWTWWRPPFCGHLPLGRLNPTLLYWTHQAQHTSRIHQIIPPQQENSWCILGDAIWGGASVIEELCNYYSYDQDFNVSY